MGRKMRVVINGFGRIGRLTLRRLLLMSEVEIVAINDLADGAMLGHLFKFDSVHGPLLKKIEVVDDELHVGSKKIQMLSIADPSQLPWAELSVDIVIESTGRFVTKESAFKHIESGAKKVIISAPGKGDIKTVVIGVNHDSLAKSDIIVSNASCTTNCLAPMIKVLDNAFGVEKGFISTVHAFTADQNLQDAPHRDWRRSRAASMSIIPTSTGAASAVGNVLPHLNGKLDGIALRVPIPDGSLTDLTVVLHQKTTSEELNDQMKKASNNSMKGVLQYSDEPLVSIDFIGNSHSCIFDSKLTTVNGNLAKVIGWYDNEFGYACRTAELAEMLFNL